MSDPNAQWQQLIETPSEWLTRAQQLEVAGQTADGADGSVLFAHPRFADRLHLLIEQHWSLPKLTSAAQPDVNDLRVYHALHHNKAGLEQLCGVLDNSATLVRLVQRHHVDALEALIGHDAFSLGLDSLELSSDHAWDWSEWIEPDRSASAPLNEQLQQAGQRVLAAWLAAQPAELSAWLQLALIQPAQAQHSVSTTSRYVAIARKAAEALSPSSTRDEEGELKNER
ncbi:hypothetical protein [Carnimonas bestiolae]|uniref:hypothetical protein n=1 Tax=Carnimonas bestiolae TaxID=3402172 RepID=UPI003EDC69CB